MSIREKLSERYFVILLFLLGTKNTTHLRGSLSSHLQGTYRLLKEWGCPHNLCLAGLFHSIYGTEIFTVKTLGYEKRYLIKFLIGKYSEKLVYLFSIAERPMSFLYSIDSKTILDKKTGVYLAVSSEELRDLIVLECANLIDQQDGRLFLEKLDRMIEKGNYTIPTEILTAVQSFLRKQ